MINESWNRMLEEHKNARERDKANHKRGNV